MRQVITSAGTVFTPVCVPVLSVGGTETSATFSLSPEKVGLVGGEEVLWERRA